MTFPASECRRSSTHAVAVGPLGEAGLLPGAYRAVTASGSPAEAPRHAGQVRRVALGQVDVASVERDRGFGVVRSYVVLG